MTWTRRNILLALVLLTLGLLLAPFQAKGQDQEAVSPPGKPGAMSAEELWEAQEHQLALAMLDSLPDDSSSSFQRCRILTMAGDHLAAAASANEYLSRWPQSPRALDCRWMLAYNAEKLGFWWDAAKRFRALADEDSLLHEVAMLHLADCHRASGRPDLAAAALESLRQRPTTFEDDIAPLPQEMVWTRNAPPQGQPAAASRMSRSLRNANRAINQGKYQYALALLARFLKNNPRSSETGLAHFLSGKCQEKMGRLGRAAECYRQAGARQPASPYADDGLFRAGWCLYKNNDIAGCLAAWDTLELRHPGSGQLAAAGYWRYRIAGETGDTAEAARVRDRVLAEQHLSYYWWRINQTETATGDSASSGESASSWQENVPADFGWWLAGRRQYRQAFRLLELGMLDDVRRLADRLREAAGNDALALFHLSLVYHRLGQDPLAIHLAKRAHGMWMGPRPRELYQVLYPRRYLHSIRTEAGNNGLDPALVLAVMRQESRFVANARSRAGARGLMQIMPKTGRRLMGAKRFKADTLYHPGTSIHYGTKFLARLLEQYQGSLVRSLGAYNAGPQRMNSWLKSARCRRDDDFLVEDINIAETREYIKRVLEGYYIYSWLLGEEGKYENGGQEVP